MRHVDINALEAIADRLASDQAFNPDRPPTLPRLALTTLRVRDFSFTSGTSLLDAPRVAALKERLSGLLPGFSYAESPCGAIEQARLAQQRLEETRAADAALDVAEDAGDGMDDDEEYPQGMLDDDDDV